MRPKPRYALVGDAKSKKKEETPDLSSVILYMKNDTWIEKKSQWKVKVPSLPKLREPWIAKKKEEKKKQQRMSCQKLYLNFTLN